MSANEILVAKMLDVLILLEHMTVNVIQDVPEILNLDANVHQSLPLTLAKGKDVEQMRNVGPEVGLVNASVQGNSQMEIRI